MQIKFYKYQGTGNDFVIIEDWQRKKEKFLKDRIMQICDRRFGIGADGCIFLQADPDSDFYMNYYNSDGNPSSMCGNGGRCIISLAHSLNRIELTTRFRAFDGYHLGKIDGEVISLQMADVLELQKEGNDISLDTGSPHYVRFVNDFSNCDVKQEGSKVRYSSKYLKHGINVNFVEMIDGEIGVATYERGVEAETLSCGTGVTASALAAKWSFPDRFTDSIKVKTKGGDLEVKYKFDGSVFKNIWLCGPAQLVFEGVLKY